MQNGKTKLDWSGNNRIPEMIEEFEEAKRYCKRAKELSNELKELMGDASIATLPGWRLEIKRIERREFTVQATVLRSLYVTRTTNETG